MAPVAVHHHLLSGLAEPELGGFDDDKKVDRVISAKMSKSKPWTCVFVHDSRDQIAEKMKKAWCPEKAVDGNPVLELVRYVVLRDGGTFAIERPAKYGGTVSYDDPSELENDYASGKIHPLDLKNSLVEPLDKHALAEAMVLLLADGDRRAHLSQTALRQATQFSLQRQADDTHAVYSGLNSEC